MLDPTRTHHLNNISLDLYDETRHLKWEATNSNLWPSMNMDYDDDDDDGDEPRWTMTSLSPVSRTEAIARGQKELMEMVQNMPESNYELSLKDLVEHHHRVREENTNDENNAKVYASGSKKIEKTPSQLKRNGKIDRGGFYLKVAFPFSLGSKEKKKKKNELLSVNSSSRVSPRPSAVCDGSVKGVVDKEKEWWKKSSLVYKESDSGESSINSGSVKSSRSSSSNSSSSRRIRSNSSRYENFIY